MIGDVDRDVPGDLAVGLHEVGVAVGQRGRARRAPSVVRRRPRVAGRHGPGALGHLAGEPVDDDVAEQPLGVRLGGGERDRQVRQPGADHDQRGALLADLVAGAAERGELGGGDVLHLVDEERDADAEVAGRGAATSVNSSIRSSSRSPESARPLAASTSIGGCHRPAAVWPCGP